MASDFWCEPFEENYRVMAVDRSTGYETRRLPNVSGGSVTRNQDTSTFESATIAIQGPVGEVPDLVRVYLDATSQVTGESRSVALGTFLVSLPKREVDGATESTSADLYGRLRELADDDFDTPYTVAAGSDAVMAAAGIARAAGLEVIADPSDYRTTAEWTFGVGGGGEDHPDTKLKAINKLLDVAGFSAAKTDAMGRVIMARYAKPQDRPVARTMREGAGCTVRRELTDELDRLAVANVIHVDYTTQKTSVRGTAVDDDPNSEWSTASVGRRIVKRYEYQDLPAGADAQAAANLKAAELLATDRSILRRVTLTCAWCPVGVGDAVRVDIPTAGVSRDYVVRTQEIDLGPMCALSMEMRNFGR